MNRWSEYLTSSTITSRPLTGGMLWNRTPFRKVKTITVGLLYSHFLGDVGHDGEVRAVLLLGPVEEDKLARHARLHRAVARGLLPRV